MKKLNKIFIRKKSFWVFASFTLFVFPLISFSLSGCARRSGPPVPGGKKISVTAVRTAYQTIGTYLKTPGNVVSLTNTAISAHIVGYVTYENVSLGQTVERGQVLIKLSAPEITSKYYAAKAGFFNAKKTYLRIKTLWVEKSVSRQMYDNARMRFMVAKANLDAALSYMRYKTVYSPITGIVTSKNVSTGDLAAPGRVLLIIQTVNNLEFKTSVNVRYYEALKKIRNVRLKFSSINKTVKGAVISVTRSANPYSHSIAVRISVSNPVENGILPGMYGVSEFKTGTALAIVVPKKAVITRLGISGVYVAGKNGEVSFQPVTTGRAYGAKYIVVTNGLTPGLTVVTSRLNSIGDGSLVSPETR